jgi:hypothetical protein
MKALALAILLAPVLAHAEPLDPLIHLDLGAELEGGDGIASAGFRGQLLLGNAFGSGRVRPELAAGATFGQGTLYVPDPRAVDGSVGLSMASYGPELQAGLQLYRDGDATTRLFASFAYFHTALDSRLAIDPVPGVGGDRGWRAAAGTNYARAVAHHLRCETKRDCNLMMLLLPQQTEFAAEHDAGSTRYGVTLSWGS